MKKLLRGIIDFRERLLEHYRENFSHLAKEGQSPDVLLVSCCDSRVVPNVFASTDPGDVFVLRNIGNLIPPYDKENHEDSSAAAAIDYALDVLKVSDIVICGHSECGAMCSFFTDNTSASVSLKQWLQYAVPSYEKFKSMPASTTLSPHNALSQVNVIQQIEHIKSYPEANEYYKKNQLRIHGWWFDLASGNIHYYNKKEEKFIILDEKEAAALLKKMS